MFVLKEGRTGLKVLVTGGEKMGEMDTCGVDVIDLYGPSENHASTAVHMAERKHPDSVGTPLPNTKTYILDAERRRVPYGAVGELFLSGYQLTLGYLNKPERNA